MKFYRFYKRFGLYMILVLVFLFFSIFAPRFFSAANFINILRQVSIFGTAVIGAAIVMIAGQCDMSVGGMVAGGWYHCRHGHDTMGDAHVGPPWCLPLYFCVAVGFINGFLTVIFLSLALSSFPGYVALVLNGLAYVVSGGYAIFGLPSNYSLEPGIYRYYSGAGHRLCGDLRAGHLPDDQDLLWPQHLCPWAEIPPRQIWPVST